MGSKYRPSIKDQKAMLRFQQNARRAAATGAVKKSIYITANPQRALKDRGTGSPEPHNPDKPRV